MSNDINGLDPNDEGLKAIFQKGNSSANFIDQTQQSAKPPKRVDRSDPVDESWHPAKPSPSPLEKIKEASLAALPHVFQIGVVFYWQLTNRLQESTGFWALLFLVGLFGVRMGRCFSTHKY